MPKPPSIIPSEVEGRTNLNAAIRAVAAYLGEGPDPATARLDAELLAAHVAGVSRENLLLSPPSEFDTARYEELARRRFGGEPLAHITGAAEFWSLPLEVNADVLIPRPDTETLIELALELRADEAPKTILDLGTGSGALLMAALSEFPRAEGLGLDMSTEAILVASRNADRLQLADRASFLIGGWEAVERGPFDLILCNPPYIDEADELGPSVREHEPHHALFAELGGLAAYEAIFPRLARLLGPAGVAIFEVGAGQGAEVREIAARHRLSMRASRKDLGGHERALAFAVT